MASGLEKLFYEPCKADPGGEFFDEQHPSVRRRIAAVEVYFNLLIAFKRNGV